MLSLDDLSDGYNNPIEITFVHDDVVIGEMRLDLEFTKSFAVLGAPIVVQAEMYLIKSIDVNSFNKVDIHLETRKEHKLRKERPDDQRTDS